MSLTPTNPQGTLTAYRIVDRHCQGIVKDTNGNREKAMMMVWLRSQRPQDKELRKASSICGLVAGIDRAISGMAIGSSLAA